MATNRKVLIAPSMLAADLSRLADEVQALEKAKADVLHFDIMDGHFVPNITFGIPVLESVRKKTALPFDAHLMITDADKYIDAFASIGCNWISVHVEACPHIHRTLSRIRELGMKAGIAINPGTSLSQVDSVLNEVDYVLVMSVNPGFGGQQFIPQTVKKLEELKQKIGKAKTTIEVDGGIKKHNIAEVASAGAEVIVVGTGLFEDKDYTAAIQQLRDACGAGK